MKENFPYWTSANKKIDESTQLLAESNRQVKITNANVAQSNNKIDQSTRLLAYYSGQRG